MSSRVAVRLLLVLGLCVSYFLTLKSCSGARFFENHFGTVSSPLFPWIQYLWWLPFGITSFLLLRKHVMQSPALRSLLFALIFAPGVLGIYGVTWLVPAFYGISVAVSNWSVWSARMLKWIAIFFGVPFCALWLLSYLAIHVTRLLRHQLSNAAGSRTNR